MCHKVQVGRSREGRVFAHFAGFAPRRKPLLPVPSPSRILILLPSTHFLLFDPVLHPFVLLCQVVALPLRGSQPLGELLSSTEFGLLLIVAKLDLCLVGLLVPDVTRIAALGQLFQVIREQKRGVAIVWRVKHFCALTELERRMAGGEADRVTRLGDGAKSLKDDAHDRSVCAGDE
jgi:hypothetical protein